MAPAPTVEWISSMKRIAFGRALSALMTALKRSSKSPRNRVPASSAPVSSAKISASFSASWHVVGQQPRREPFGHRRLADAGLADEHRVVLAAAAQHFDRALQLVGVRPISGSSSPCARALGQVRAVRRQRIARRRRILRRRRRLRCRAAPGRGAAGGRHLRDAVRDVLEDVEPRDALLGQQLRRVASSAAGGSPRGCRRPSLRRAARSARAAPPSAARGGTPPSAPARARRRASAARSTRRGRRRARGAARGRSAPQAARIRSPSGSCASA